MARDAEAFTGGFGTCQWESNGGIAESPEDHPLVVDVDAYRKLLVLDAQAVT
jgi:hypothetical protein